MTMKIGHEGLMKAIACVQTYFTVAYFLIFSSAPGVMDGALPAMGAAGISNTSTRSPPPVSAAAKLFVTGAAGSVWNRSMTNKW